LRTEEYRDRAYDLIRPVKQFENNLPGDASHQIGIEKEAHNFFPKLKNRGNNKCTQSETRLKNRKVSGSCRTETTQLSCSVDAGV